MVVADYVRKVGMKNLYLYTIDELRSVQRCIRAGVQTFLAGTNSQLDRDKFIQQALPLIKYICTKLHLTPTGSKIDYLTRDWNRRVRDTLYAIASVQKRYMKRGAQKKLEAQQIDMELEAQRPRSRLGTFNAEHTYSEHDGGTFEEPPLLSPGNGDHDKSRTRSHFDSIPTSTLSVSL